MFVRIFLAISILSLLFGQLPQSVTVCLCTGEVGVTNVKATDFCESHALPKCSHCHPTPRKSCYVTKARLGPPSAIVGHWTSPDIPVILPISISVIEAGWRPAIEPQPWFVLPRIREPDIGGHLLRAPPTFA